MALSSVVTICCSRHDSSCHNSGLFSRAERSRRRPTFLYTCSFDRLAQRQGPTANDALGRRGGHQEGGNAGAERHPRRMEKCIRLEGIASKGGRCSLLLAIGMYCLWRGSRCFSRRPRTSCTPYASRFGNARPQENFVCINFKAAWRLHRVSAKSAYMGGFRYLFYLFI